MHPVWQSDSRETRIGKEKTKLAILFDSLICPIEIHVGKRKVMNYTRL